MLPSDKKLYFILIKTICLQKETVKQNLRLETVEVRTTIQGRSQAKITLQMFIIILAMEAITLPQVQHPMAI
jgi:hypothetical protein